jgi:PAS domain S-box-containing protein
VTSGGSASTIRRFWDERGLAAVPIKELLEKSDVFPDPVLLVSVDGTIETSNRHFAEQFGFDPQALSGKRLHNLAELSAGAIEEYLRACARSEKALRRSLTFKRRGRVVPFRARGVAYPPTAAPSASQVLLYLQSMRDTVRKAVSSGAVHLDADSQHWQEVEDSLRRQARILEVTLASIGDAVIVTDAEGRVTFLNAVAERLTGWSAEEARYRPLPAVFQIVNEHTRQPVEDPVGKVLRTGMVAGLANHTVLLSRTGQEAPIDDSAAPIQLPDGQIFGVVLIFRDITEQRQAEHARGWLASIVESSEDAIIGKRLDGTITSWNPAAARLFGYSPEEIIGQPVTRIIPPELQPEEEDILRRLKRGERVEHFETVRLARDGRRVDVSLTISPIKNEAGEVVGASKIARDISKRKQTELLLRDADRRKDEFLATLGHELRNPLGTVRNAFELLCRAEHSRPELRTACGILDRQIKLMSRLVDDLLNVSRIAAGRLQLRREPLDLGALLIDVAESLRHQFEAKDQTLTYSLGGAAVRVFGDRDRLLQVFSNLLHNAHKYTQPGGHIEVTLRREGRNVLVSVRDDGLGIPPHLLDEVFQLFQQVGRESGRASQGGLGIGLALARNLAHMHGGEIHARSAGAGRGSEFIVELPILDEQGEAALPCERPRLPQSARKILIADDNRDAALSLAILLGNMGHETRVAYDGLETLEVAREFQPDLIFIDLVMPKLNGYEVAQRLKGEAWTASTLLVALTSWRDDHDQERAKAAGFHRHVLKPLQPEALQELLEATPGP